MVKKTNKDKDLLLSYVRFGEGKVSTVDQRFNISKNYRVSVSMTLDTEVNSLSEQTAQVTLSEEEKEIVDGFIKNKLIPMSRKMPLFDGTIEEYETRYIMYDGMKIKNEEVCDLFTNVVDFIESQHEELTSSKIARMYNDMCRTITRK